MSRPPLSYRIAQFFTRAAARIGDAWNWAVNPIERFFGRLGEGAFGALDSFEGLESAVASFLRFLFWPLILIGRLLGRLLPSGNGTGGALGRVYRSFGRRLYEAAERLNLDGVVRLVVWLLTPVWWPLAQVLGFANAWLATRQSRELLLAVPAALVAMPFAYVALQGAVLSTDDIAERYKVAVREAVDAGEYQLVDLYERKLAQLGVDTRRRDYRTALTLEDDGQLSAAYERMKRLAPAETPGYPSAHSWIAQRLLSGDLTEDDEPELAGSSEARFELAEDHLQRLEDMEIAGAGLAQLRAIVYANTDRLREGSESLAPYAPTDLAAAGMRMRLLTQLRDLPLAKEQAKSYLDLRGRRGRGLRAKRDDFEAWALAAELLRDPAQMESALEAWRLAEPDNERPRNLLAKYRREQAVRLSRNPTASPERAAEMLIEAVRLGSPESWITEQARQLATARTKKGDHKRRIWQNLIDRPELPDPLTLMLGTAAAGANQIEPARTLFVRLAGPDSKNAIALNNYAWTLVQEPMPDPDAALLAIDRALELRPGDHRFRETRGQVLVALGRWQQAVEDLEYALNGLAEAPDVHKALAIAYEAMAQPQLAEVHRRQAAR